MLVASSAVRHDEAMYSTCLFCNVGLGRNEALEAFPIGRRLAFDARQGRLWVVCRSCERWNLTPLEERWEAIEQAERLFRAAKQRVCTENIGLTRLPSRTELVRIGEPLRPEYAAWRYGDQFGKRRLRQILLAGGGVCAMGALVAGQAAIDGLFVTVGVLGATIHQAIGTIVHGRAERVVARIRASELGTVAVQRQHLAQTRLVPGRDTHLAIEFRFKNGEALLEGREALRVAGILMPHVNRYGGDKEALQFAVKALDDAGGADDYLRNLSKYASDATEVPLGYSNKPRSEKSWTGAYTSGLFGLSTPDRLALEMALHEEAELRALRGELSELERAWRDAEEIAAIADNMLMPPSIQATLDELRHTNEPAKRAGQ
jgi:hypothetical protein